MTFYPVHLPAVGVTPVLPSGDITGATDTAAIQAVYTAGKSVQLDSRQTYYLSAPLTLTGNGQVLDLNGATIQPGSAFTGTALVQVTGNNCTVRDGSFYGGSSTTTSNPAAGAVLLTAALGAFVTGLAFQNINGWCVESDCHVNNGFGTIISDLYGLQCAGGLFIFGKGASTQHEVSNCNFEQIGVATGPNAALDCYLLSGAQDVQLSNLDGGFPDNSGGSGVHIVGKCGTVYFTNLDIGSAVPSGAGSGATILIENDGGGNGPQDIRFTSFGVGGGAGYGISITATALRIRFVNGHIANSVLSGMSVTGAVKYIEMDTVEFGGSGTGAAGSNYDIIWNGSGTQGYFRNCLFTSGIQPMGTSGVVQTISCGSGQTLDFFNCEFQGTNNTGLATAFTNTPELVRGCKGVNPVGAVTVAVPATGVATAASGFDRVFYVSANAAGATSVVVSGLAATGSIGIPQSATVAVSVPAGSTITPTYTAGDPPTWTVQAL